MMRNLALTGLILFVQWVLVLSMDSTRGFRARNSVSNKAKIGIFYSTMSGNTAKIANLIASSTLSNAEVRCIDDCTNVDEWDAYIFGSPTLNTGAEFDRSGTKFDVWLYDKLPLLDFNDKKVAIFGLGNARGYSYYFCDAAGEIYDRLSDAGANVMGSKVDPNDYNFDESRALRNGLFIGMMFDEENEPDKHQERVTLWLDMLRKDGFPI